MEYDNFVFYGGWRETLEGFREDFGDDFAKEALWNLMLMATAGDVETDKRSILGFLTGTVMPTINKAKDRYAAAVKNGKKGGRPTVQLDKEEVMKKKKELKTWKAVAQYYEIEEDTLRKIRKQWEINEEEEKTEKPKNLDKDNDIDKDIDNDKEKDNRPSFDYRHPSLKDGCAQKGTTDLKLGF